MIKNFTSRYANTKLIVDKKGRYHHSLYRKPRIPEDVNDKYHIVQKLEANRLDLISKTYYGVEGYWWIIAIANNILDATTVPEGKILRIPSIITALNSL